jgi:hypothetical protein
MMVYTTIYLKKPKKVMTALSAHEVLVRIEIRQAKEKEMQVEFILQTLLIATILVMGEWTAPKMQNTSLELK